MLADVPNLFYVLGVPALSLIALVAVSYFALFPLLGRVMHVSAEPGQIAADAGGSDDED